jgi:stage II sporulation protein D
MLRRLTLLALISPLVLVGAGWSGASPDRVTVTTFAISGHGWGHGVGMSQWGALGQAKRGITYDKILRYYYRGTVLGQAGGAKVRVLLAEGSAAAVGSPSAFRVEDGRGALHDLPSGAYTVGAKLALPVEAPPPKKPTSKGVKPRPKPALKPRPLPGPLTLIPGTAPLELGGRPYRGKLELQLVENRLQVVNVVGLDAYAFGVVTQEMPKDWPLEALKAQAVAARSFAVSMRQEKLVLYADTRGQVYGGVDAETPASKAAVEATRGQVLLYGGKVARTFFFSSSGGRTASVSALLPNAKPIPYLVAVDDPYDVVSPYHDWGPVTFSAATVAKLLGVRGIDDLRSVPSTGHASEVVADAAGAQTTLSAQTVRLALGLRSTWFRAGVLSLSRPAGPFPAGGAVTLTGVARRLQGPVRLERSLTGRAWVADSMVAPGRDGSFSVDVTPAATTLYRLSTKTAASSVLRVPVRPKPKAKPKPPASSRTLSSAAASAQEAGPERAAFTTDDPLVSRQWYLLQDRAFDFWPELPVLNPVKVAVIDTGIDAGHPEFQGKIAAKKSFVGQKVFDKIGHGTFVAGVIAAAAGNGQGIAGIAFPAQLVIAKVVGPDGTIDPDVEARAIRWAVDEGARVINLSLGGLRDPLDLKRDTFSNDERSAIEYAYANGALVVAAVGNGDQAPSSPWPYASYPAALPHVIGVSALAQDGSVPAFSNRDAIFNDVAAPGEAIVSTLPRWLTAEDPLCTEQGYSVCGPSGFRDASGTSFAAPQVSAAAALLFADRPDLTPDQVSAVLERTAADIVPANGCRRCSFGRDALSGWGRLDIAAALQAVGAPLPPPDRLETNDDAGDLAPRLWGRSISVRASIDFWDDQIDVYRVKLRAGERVAVSLHGPSGTDTNLVLWKPGTEHVEGFSEELARQRATQSTAAGSVQNIGYRTGRGGWYFVEVKAGSSGSGPYVLKITKST